MYVLQRHTYYLFEGIPAAFFRTIFAYNMRHKKVSFFDVTFHSSFLLHQGLFPMFKSFSITALVVVLAVFVAYCQAQPAPIDGKDSASSKPPTRQELLDECYKKCDASNTDPHYLKMCKTYDCAEYQVVPPVSAPVSREGLAAGIMGQPSQ